MEFDSERVATALDAEKIHEGDLVLAADTLLSLRGQVKNVMQQHYWIVESVQGEDKRDRFKCEGANIPYTLAYLLATAENVEAFDYWVKTGCSNDSVKIVKGECNSEVPEFWNREVTYAINEAQGWRPYRDVRELLDDWYRKTDIDETDYQMPSIWLRAKGGMTRLITGFADDEVYIGIHNWTMKELFEQFEYIDGSPCGVYD